MLSPRQSLSEVLQVLPSPRQAVSGVDGFASPRQGLSEMDAIRNSPRQGALELTAEEFATYWVNVQQAAATWGDDLRHIVPQPIPTLDINGVDLSELLQSLDITRPMNGKSTLSFTLGLPTDANGVVVQPSNLCPPGYGPFAGLIKHHDKTSGRMLTLTVTMAGESRTFYFLPTAPIFDGQSLYWGGEDVVALAEADRTDGEDIIADTGDYVTAHTSIKMDALSVGFSAECRFKDYRINELRKNIGSTISWMDRCAKPMQATRRTDGTRVIYQSLPRVLDGASLGGARWQFVDRQNIQTVKINQLTPPRNRFTATRIKSISSVLEEPLECSGNQCIGRHPITLKNPATFVQVQVTKVAQGSLVDFVFFGPNDEILAGPNFGVYSGAIPCHRIEFTYLPAISNFAYTPTWEMYLRGGSPSSTQPEVLEGFEAEAEDAASIAEVGLNPESSNLEDPIYHDPTTGQDSCEAHLNAAILHHWQGAFTTPYLNPLLDPGDVIAVTDYTTRQSATTWLVTVAKFRWEKFWSMALDAVRPA